MGQCWQYIYLTEKDCPISFTWFQLAVVPCFSIAGVRVVNLSMGMHFCLSLRIIHKDKAIFLIQAELVWPTPGVIRAAVCWPCCCCPVWWWPRPVAGAAWLTLALLQFCVLACAWIICLGVTAVLFVGFLPWIHPRGEKTLLARLLIARAFSLFCCCTTYNPTGTTTVWPEGNCTQASPSLCRDSAPAIVNTSRNHTIHLLCTGLSENSTP